jgi:hypothetical protein
MAETTFWKAFVKAQSEFPQISKDSTADAGKYSYKYASLPAVTEAVLPVLNKHGISMWQTFRDGVLVTHLTHESGEGIESGVACSEAGLTPQDFGKKISYYRRYALVALLGLAPDDDDDATGVPAAAPAAARKTTPPPPATPPPVSDYEAKIRELFDAGVGGLIGYVDNPRDEMKARMLRLLGSHGCEKASELTGDARAAFLADLRETVDEIRKASEQ